MDPPITPPPVIRRPSPRSSSVSDLSTPSLSRRRNSSHSLSLSNLATNSTQTPIRREQCDPPGDTIASKPLYDAMEDEEAIDRQFYGDGASDSEDEADDFLAETAQSRQEFDDGNVAAEVNESDFIASMLVEAEQNNEGRKSLVLQTIGSHRRHQKIGHHQSHCLDVLTQHLKKLTILEDGQTTLFKQSTRGKETK